MRKYSIDFKKMVVDDYTNGLSKETVASKYNVAPSSVALWTREYRTNNQPSVSRDEYLEQQELSRLRIDNQIFAECRCTRFSPVSERIDEVLRLKDKYSIHALCRVLDVNRSAVYHRDRRAPEKTLVEIEDEKLMPLIKEIFYEGREVLGAKRIRPKLRSMGYVVSERRVSRLMKQMGLKVEYGTKYNYTLRENRPYYVNRLRREFKPEAPNRAWVSDISMVRVGTKVLFICTVMDLYARKIISYTIADNMHTNIVSDALIKAYLARGCPEGLIFHSDQGTQYTAYTVKLMMRGEGITLSYSNVGCPYDNAVGESFFSTLKKEHIYRYDFQDEWEFKVSIQEYIEFYNGYRPHSTIGYLTPDEAEEMYFAENKVS